MIEFKCPKCSLLIQATPASVGKFKKCPHCESKIQVPLPRKTSPETPVPPVFEQARSQESVTQPLSQIEITEVPNLGSSRNEHRAVGIRYPALTFLSNIYRAFAIITAISTVIGTIFLVINGIDTKNSEESLNFYFSAILLPFSGIFSVIVLLSISELIKVFLQIEKNTRKY